MKMMRNHLLYMVVLVVCNHLFRSSFGTETPLHYVVRHFDDFEIKFYPKATWVSLDLKGKPDYTFDKSTIDGLLKIASYVGGENEKHLKLNTATAPAVTGINSSMKLTGVEVYLGNGTNFPKPNPELELTITEWAPKCVAVRKFFHEVDEFGKVIKEIDALGKSLYHKGIEREIGTYFIAQYNITDFTTLNTISSQPFNEVWIPTFDCNSFFSFAKLIT